MKTSASRLILTALGLLVVSPLARADALSDGRAALASGDFATAKTQFDAYLANAESPNADDARVLRAFARLGSAIQDELPAALRTKLGANVADLDLGSGNLALRFPRPVGYFNVPSFTTVGAYYEYAPALNLEETPGDQPSISFENRGSSSYSLTLTVSQPGEFYFDSTLYLDGLPLGYVNAFNGFPFQVFTPPIFEISSDIPKPFDLDLSTPDHYLSAGSNPNSFTVVIPPKSNFTIGLVRSTGDLRFTPATPPPSTVVVLNGKAASITQPRLANNANFSGIFALAGQLETSSLAPAIADLEATTTNVNLVLHPEETGSAIDTVIAYPDVQILLAELKFLQGVRRLGASYNFSLPLTPANLSAEPMQLLLKNPKFLTPNGPDKTQALDRIFARQRFSEAAAHYASASESGLWSRTAPESGAYLFGVPGDGDLTFLKESFDSVIALLDNALTDTTPLAYLSPVAGADLPATAGFSFAPLFGSPAVDVRKLVPAVTENGVQRGGSLALLTSGLLPGFGTEGWESLLASGGNLDLSTPAIQSAVKIQRQPAALTSVAEGDPVTLSVVAESYPVPTYRWYRRVGNNEELVSEGSPFFFLEAAHRDDAGNYFVRVSNTVTRPPKAPVVTTRDSITAVLEVTYAPSIVTQPADITIYQDKTITLAASAVGVPKPMFQWFKGDTAVTSPSLNSTYKFKATVDKAGDYHVVVKNSRGEETSENATLEIQTRPVFTTQPLSQTVVAGGSVTFTAAATGNPTPQIKWRKNGKDLPGAVGAALTIDSVTLAHRGVYTAVAFSTVQTGPTSTAIASTTSSGARLTVTEAP